MPLLWSVSSVAWPSHFKRFPQQKPCNRSISDQNKQFTGHEYQVRMAAYVVLEWMATEIISKTKQACWQSCSSGFPTNMQCIFNTPLCPSFFLFISASSWSASTVGSQRDASRYVCLRLIVPMQHAKRPLPSNQNPHPMRHWARLCTTMLPMLVGHTRMYVLSD